jgi:hypothetical protein
MAKPRREFLGWLGASTVVAATAGSPLHAGEPGHARRAGDTGPRTPLSAEWDVSWTDRIQGKHRAVFDSPAVSEGAALFRAVMWRDQYKEVYGTEPGEMSAVVVIRHTAIPLAMNDAYWARFGIGKEEKLKDPGTKKWYVKNPIRASAPDAPPRWAAYSLEAFMASGGIVLACDLAFRMVIAKFREADKLTGEQARAAAREQLLPGIILQPSGIFATLRAQQAGCSYILAS